MLPNHTIILNLFCLGRVGSDFLLHTCNRRHKRTHHPRVLWFVIGLATDLGFWATRWLHRCTRRTALGLGARDHGATGRWRARRARTDLTRLITRADTRRARRHRRFQDITGHIGRRTTLRL